jgi:hypothetical protein
MRSLAREVFTSDFWMSGNAMLKYIPRSFRVKQVDGMIFFTEAKHEEFRKRVLRITSANLRQWGTMNVSQMMHHLNLACGSPLGFYTLPDESYLLYCQRASISRTVHNLSSTLKNNNRSKSSISAADWRPHPMFG